MHFVESGGGCWPTPAQELLLDAAIGLRKVSSIWPDYERQIAGTRVNSGERRLYPLLASQLTDFERHQPYWATLMRARMATLARYAVSRRHVDDILDLLAANGIEVIVIKGFALIASVYRDSTLRPAADVDLMVRPQQLAQAVALIEKRGAQSMRKHPHLTPSVLKYRCSGFDYTFPDGTGCDIHINLRKETVFLDDVLQRFWNNSRCTEWDGRRWRVPSQTWLLIEAIVHGVKWNEVHAVRWVVDADRLLRQGQIDWNEVLDLANRAKLTTLLQKALSYLAKRGAPVPQHVLDEMSRRRISVLERWEYRMRTRREGFLGDYFPLQPMNYWLRSRGSMSHRIRNFLPYCLEAGAGVATPGALLTVATQKFRSRMRQHRGARPPKEQRSASEPER